MQRDGRRYAHFIGRGIDELLAGTMDTTGPEGK